MENETYLETAVRECEEEYGLKIKPQDFKFICKYDHDDIKDDHVFISKVPEDVSINLHEGGGFKWLTFEELNGLELGFEQEKILSEIKKYND